MKVNTQNIPFFSVFSKEEIENFKSILKEEVFTENQIIFQK